MYARAAELSTDETDGARESVVEAAGKRQWWGWGDTEGLVSS